MDSQTPHGFNVVFFEPCFPWIWRTARGAGVVLEDGFYVRHDSDVLGLLRGCFLGLPLLCFLLEMGWGWLNLGFGVEYTGP